MSKALTTLAVYKIRDQAKAFNRGKYSASLETLANKANGLALQRALEVKRERRRKS